MLLEALRGDVDEDGPQIGGIAVALDQPELLQPRMATVVVGVRTRSWAASSVIRIGP